MSAAHIIQTLAAAGIDLDLNEDGKLTAPADRLTDEMRQAIKAHKGEIIDQLTRAKRLTQQLTHAAMMACDCWQDNEAARAEMQQQCQDATPAEQQELLRYFQQAYRGCGVRAARNHLGTSTPHPMARVIHQPRCSTSGRLAKNCFQALQITIGEHGLT